MNKKIISLSLIIVLIIPLWANKIDRILLGTGNDMWTMGLSRNDDDQLSYSAFVLLEFKNAYISADFQGITNRGYKNGWQPGKSTFSNEPLYSGRYDSIPISFGVNNTTYFDHLSLNTSLEIGLLLAGKLGLDFFQNNSHDVLRIHGVSLKYDTDNFNGYFITKTGNTLNLKIYGFDDTTLNIGAYFNYSLAFHFQESISIGSGFYASKNNKNILGVQIGYQVASSFSALPTQQLYAKYLNGAKTNFFFDTGLIFVSYEAYPNTGYGYTKVAMNFLPNDQGFLWHKSDIYLGLGMSYFMQNSLWTLRCRMPLNPSISIFFENRNISGYATDENAELKSNLSTDGRSKKGYNFFLLGIEYRLKQNLFEVYSNISIGIFNFKYYKLLNTISTSTIPYEDIGSGTLFATDFAVGTTLFPEDLIINGYSSYRLSIEAGATILYNAKDDLYLMNKYDRDAKNKLGTILPKLTVLLEIGLDL